MNFNTMTDETKTMRVWWNTGGGLTTYYYIDKIEDAKIITDILSIRELYDESIGFNAYGVEVLEDDEWNEWYSEEGLDAQEHFESDESVKHFENKRSDTMIITFDPNGNIKIKETSSFFDEYEEFDDVESIDIDYDDSDEYLWN